jgi:hypothetical protein
VPVNEAVGRILAVGNWGDGWRIVSATEDEVVCANLITVWTAVRDGKVEVVR